MAGFEAQAMAWHNLCHRGCWFHPEYIYCYMLPKGFSDSNFLNFFMYDYKYNATLERFMNLMFYSFFQ